MTEHINIQSDTQYIFVYGTLRDSNINHKAHFLHELAHYIGPAHIHARLYKVTWYPAVVLDQDPENRVYGDIYQLPLASREMILHELDGYEGIYSTNEDSEEYERVIAEAYFEDGSAARCWVYNYKRALPESTRIHSGDYLLYLRGNR